MEYTDVIVVGAGPSGLALGIALAHRGVSSMTLESNKEICEDPRAIAISGDTHRILNLLGINQEKLQEFGQSVKSINIHRQFFTEKAYFTLDHGKDYLGQALNSGSLIFQPKLEQALRDLTQNSACSELRLQSEVVGCRKIDDGVEVTYKRDGTERRIRGSFLVGADGKRGFVRKSFLEPLGVKQEIGIHNYAATWIAANLKVKLPTPQSHPDLPLWELGLTPNDAWELFWPDGFHFCNHPTRPVAAGRFGSLNDKYWRFEYELPSGYMPEDLEKELQKEMEPHLTLQPRYFKGKYISSTMTFPWDDCVEIIRCRPAYFVHKCVNRWFDDRTILIGDAAHVFPPFGAQGIANGLRDAFALSWRLALLCGPNSAAHVFSKRSQSLLYDWSQERRKAVNEASKFTMANGDLLNIKSPFKAFGVGIANNILLAFPSLRERFHRKLMVDTEGFVGVKEGVFLQGQGGGGKIAQIWVRGTDGSKRLSDFIFWTSKSALTLLILHPASKDEIEDIQSKLTAANLPTHIMSRDIASISIDGSSTDVEGGFLTTDSHYQVRFYCAYTASELSKECINIPIDYNPKAFQDRFHGKTRYALIRPDFIIFSQASRSEQLSAQLRCVQEMIAP